MSDDKYLDLTGLQHFKEKLDETFVDQDHAFTNQEIIDIFNAAGSGGGEILIGNVLYDVSYDESRNAIILGRYNSPSATIDLSEFNDFVKKVDNGWIIGQDAETGFTISHANTAAPTLNIKSGGRGAAFFGDAAADGELSVFGNLKVTNKIYADNDAGGLNLNGAYTVKNRFVTGAWVNTWIRIAKRELYNSYFANESLRIDLWRYYNSATPESYSIQMNTGWGTAHFTQIQGYAATRKITALRVVVEDGIAYLEMYFTNGDNDIHYRLTSYGEGMQPRSPWIPMAEQDTAVASYDTKEKGRIELNPNGMVTSGTIMMQGHSSAIGSVLASAKQTTSIANQTTTSGATITVTKGKWLVQGYAVFDVNATGPRQASVNKGSGAAWNADNIVYTQAATGGSKTALQVQCIFDAVDNDVFKVWLWQGSGSTLSCDTIIKAIRLQ